MKLGSLVQNGQSFPIIFSEKRRRIWEFIEKSNLFDPHQPPLMILPHLRSMRKLAVTQMLTNVGKGAVSILLARSLPKNYKKEFLKRKNTHSLIGQPNMNKVPNITPCKQKKFSMRHHENKHPTMQTI